MSVKPTLGLKMPKGNFESTALLETETAATPMNEATKEQAPVPKLKNIAPDFGGGENSKSKANEVDMVDVDKEYEKELGKVSKAVKTAIDMEPRDDLTSVYAIIDMENPTDELESKSSSSVHSGLSSKSSKSDSDVDEINTKIKFDLLDLKKTQYAKDFENPNFWLGLS